MNIYHPSWVDLAVVVTLIVGMVRGRKRGVSEELLDVFKWLIIVVGASFVYEPIGEFLASVTPFSLLSCYMGSYMAIIGIVFGFFSLVKQAVGSKLVESDAFGPAEYYMGIVAGFVRYTCILFVVFSFLNARYYSPAEVTARHQYNMNNYGMTIFSMSEIQAEVFQRSFFGALTVDYLSPFMIRPTAPEEKSLGGNRRAVRAREGTMHEILD